MKQLIWLIFLFLCAIGLALAAKTYSGNVYLVIEHTMIRVNLHAFILGVALFVGILYVLLKFLAGVLGISGKLGQFGITRRTRKATQELSAAGLAYFEGKFQEAEQHAKKVLANKNAGDNRILALMLAAYSAEQYGNVEQRNQYLAQIAKLPEKMQLSRYLLLAESALNQGDFETANNELKAAESIQPRLTRLARLQLRLALDKGDALDILDKMDKLHRAGEIGDAEAQKIGETAYRHLLTMANDSAGLKACLKRIPNALQNGILDAAIAQKYVDLGLYHDAIAWVSKHYPITRDEALLSPFEAAVRQSDELTQQRAIDTADAWLHDNPKDARLLRCLGELAFNRELWGKAQGYLQASLAIEETVPARLMLAKVFEHANRLDAAQEQRKLVLAQLSE